MVANNKCLFQIHLEEEVTHERKWKRVALTNPPKKGRSTKDIYVNIEHRRTIRILHKKDNEDEFHVFSPSDSKESKKRYHKVYMRLKAWGMTGWDNREQHVKNVFPRGCGLYASYGCYGIEPRKNPVSLNWIKHYQTIRNRVKKSLTEQEGFVDSKRQNEMLILSTIEGTTSTFYDECVFGVVKHAEAMNIMEQVVKTKHYMRMNVLNQITK